MTTQAVVRSAFVLIANHYPERDLSASWLSDRLGISPKDLEAAFRQHHSLACDLSILNYRLSRLFERITTQPQTALEQQVMTCGLGSIQAADQHFLASFGITLEAFHAVSLRAAEDRQFRRRHPNPDSLIINE